MVDRPAQAELLSRVILNLADNNPADALTAMCEVTAELLKTSENSTKLKETFIRFLDEFMKQPNRLLVIEDCKEGDNANIH